MNIVPKTKVAEAYQRAMGLHACHQSAVRAVARSLCIPEEAVAEVVGGEA